MIQCLAPCTSAGGQAFFFTYTQMENSLKEAVLTSIKLYDQIDFYRLPQELQIKYKGLGQCLRTALELTTNDKQQNTTTQ
jgi:hypothetical protein